MPEKNVNQEPRFNKIDEIRKYLIKEINQNELMSKKHINVSRSVNYIDHLIIVVSTITRYVSISPFASLVDISIGITSSVIGLKICIITAGIKKYRSIIKKKVRRTIK